MKNVTIDSNTFRKEIEYDNRRPIVYEYTKEPVKSSYGYHVILRVSYISSVTNKVCVVNLKKNRMSIIYNILCYDIMLTFIQNAISFYV